jgi:hypothetical protein
MLYEDIWLAEARDNRHKKRFEDRVRFVRDRKPDWASQFDIDPRLWYLWPKSLTPTKVGPHVDASDIAAATSKEQDDLRQSVRILDEGTNKSQPITEVDDALMRLLGDCPLFAIRLYVLLPPEKQHLEKDIREHVEKEWPP